MEHDGICHPMLPCFKDADGASSSWKMEPGCEVTDLLAKNKER